LKFDLFNENIGVNKNKWHPKVGFLNDDILYREREIIKRWTEGLIDRDNKMLVEFQTTFHSCFWEFYLYALFCQMGFTLDQSHNRPDFIINKPYQLYIEAVVANISKSGANESQRSANDLLSMVSPPYVQQGFYLHLNESISRLSNSILTKKTKFTDSYAKCDWVKEEVPFAIALSSYDQINYGREYIYPLMALLYGLYYNAIEDTFEARNRIIKPGSEAQIPLGIFLNPEYEMISGIIFTCTHTIGKLVSLAISESGPLTNIVYNIRHDINDKNIPYKIQIVNHDNPELLDDGLILFHNPNAKFKIPLEMFGNTNITQISFKNGKIVSSIDTYPIVARLNINKGLERLFKPYIEQQLMLYNRFDMNKVLKHFKDNFM
jgi:hypothetical protein